MFHLLDQSQFVALYRLAKHSSFSLVDVGFLSPLEQSQGGAWKTLLKNPEYNYENLSTWLPRHFRKSISKYWNNSINMSYLYRGNIPPYLVIIPTTAIQNHTRVNGEVGQLRQKSFKVLDEENCHGLWGKVWNRFYISLFNNYINRLLPIWSW